MYPPMKVHIYGNSNADWWMYNQTRSAVPMMCKNPKLFGLGQNSDAPCNVESITVTGSAVANARDDDIKDFDVIFVSYDISPDNTMADALADYVTNKQGTVVACADAGRANFIRRMLDRITPNNGITFSAGIVGDNLMSFVSGNPAVNGSYMNLAGKQFGRNGAGNFSFQNVHEDWVVIGGGTRAAARVIMHKEYRIFLSGDGGIWTGGVPNFYEVAEYHAARVDAEGNPIPATQSPFNGNAYNSAFLANVLMWGFEFSGSASATNR
jgi:hypothetical protein